MSHLYDYTFYIRTSDNECQEPEVIYCDTYTKVLGKYVLESHIYDTPEIILSYIIPEFYVLSIVKRK